MIKKLQVLLVYVLCITGLSATEHIIDIIHNPQTKITSDETKPLIATYPANNFIAIERNRKVSTCLDRFLSIDYNCLVVTGRVANFTAWSSGITIVVLNSATKMGFEFAFLNNYSQPIYFTLGAIGIVTKSLYYYTQNACTEVQKQIFQENQLLTRS